MEIYPKLEMIMASLPLLFHRIEYKTIKFSAIVSAFAILLDFSGTGVNTYFMSKFVLFIKYKPAHVKLRNRKWLLLEAFSSEISHVGVVMNR